MKRRKEHKSKKLSHRMILRAGYTLPDYFPEPKINVRMWHFFLMLSFVVYALISIPDIYKSASVSLYGCILRFLSVITVCVNLCYKKSVRMYEINHEKNRRKLKKRKNGNHNVYDTGYVLNEKIYSNPIRIELVISVFALIIPVIMCFWECSFVFVIYKVVIFVQAMVNCLISSVGSMAEYYKAKDILYVK